MISATRSFTNYGFNYRSTLPSFKQTPSYQDISNTEKVYATLKDGYDRQETYAKRREWLEGQLRELKEKAGSPEKFGRMMQELTGFQGDVESSPNTEFHKDLCLFHDVFIAEKSGLASRSLGPFSMANYTLRNPWTLQDNEKEPGRIVEKQKPDRYSTGTYAALRDGYNKLEAPAERREWLKGQLRELKKQAGDTEKFVSTMQKLTGLQGDFDSQPYASFHTDLCLFHLVFMAETFGFNSPHLEPVESNIYSFRTGLPKGTDELSFDLNRALGRMYCWTIADQENKERDLREIFKKERLHRYSLNK